MSTVVDKVIAAVEQQRQAAAGAFRDLALSIADGTEPEPDAVETVLQAAGHTLDDLRQAVEVILRRRELRAEIATEPELVARRDELQAEIAAVEAAFTEQRQEHERRLQPLFAELDQVGASIRQVSAAQHELWRLVDPSVLENVETLRQVAQDAQDAVIEARKRVSGCRSSLDAAQHKADNLGPRFAGETWEIVRPAQEALAAAEQEVVEAEVAAQAALAEFQAAEAAAV